jgi:NAD dependent epimerase/dehydratase family enzyme
VPALVLRVLFGEKAVETLLAGQRVIPRRLLEAGFDFRHPDAETAIAALLK